MLRIETRYNLKGYFMKHFFCCYIDKILLSVVFVLITGCTGMPKGIQPVANFELDKYLGTWYEIARLDHSFERGMNQVTATYSLKDDGGVKVINRGFSETEKQWRQAEGKAYFVDDINEGYLKVSFFGPFYGSYVIFELEQQNYQYAFISGPNLDYLWLLSRTLTVPQAVIDKFVAMSDARGFETDKLIFVKQ